MHLNERFAPGFSDVHFVTFDHPQPRSLLPRVQVAYIPPVHPRDLAGSLRTMSTAADLLDRYDPTAVISTGAAVAVPFLLQARRRGIAAHYIESAARTHGPSLTGRLVSRIPGVSLYTQHGPWSSRKWGYRGSVFDGYEAVARSDTPRSPRLVVVTLGTLDQFPFRRAVEAILPVVRQLADAGTRVLWQVGNIPVADLGIRGIQAIPADELQAALHDADLVFAHAGVGSCLRILDAGRVPVLLPRAPEHGEHVDDHQRLVAASLTRRGLAIQADPASLTVAMARSAMSRRVRRRSSPPRFSLA